MFISWSDWKIIDISTYLHFKKIFARPLWSLENENRIDCEYWKFCMPDIYWRCLLCGELWRSFQSGWTQSVRGLLTLQYDNLVALLAPCENFNKFHLSLCNNETWRTERGRQALNSHTIYLMISYFRVRNKKVYLSGVEVIPVGNIGCNLGQSTNCHHLPDLPVLRAPVPLLFRSQ